MRKLGNKQTPWKLQICGIEMRNGSSNTLLEVNTKSRISSFGKQHGGFSTSISDVEKPKTRNELDYIYTNSPDVATAETVINKVDFGSDHMQSIVYYFGDCIICICYIVSLLIKWKQL